MTLFLTFEIDRICIQPIEDLECFWLSMYMVHKNSTTRESVILGIMSVRSIDYFRSFSSYHYSVNQIIPWRHRQLKYQISLPGA